MSEMSSGLHPVEGPVASPAPVDGGVVGPESPARAHSRFPGHALTPTGVMAIRCKQFHLPDL